MRPQLLFALFFCFSFWVEGQIHYVKMDGTGDGTSWANAQGNLQTVFENVAEGDTVFVAEGIYNPVTCTTCSEAERATSFHINHSIVLLGGFPGTGNPVLSDQDWESFPTILSGDIGVLNDSSDNSLRILNSDGTLTIKGLTISNANSDIISMNGAGVQAKSLFAYDCTFENNLTTGNGGAVAIMEGNDEDQSLNLYDCRFTDNIAESGGAVFVSENLTCNTFIFDCEYHNNVATVSGGAITIEDGNSHTELNRCSFVNNTAVDGGGVYLGYSDWTSRIENSLFHNNQALQNGGALYIDRSSRFLLSTFANNTAMLQGNVVYASDSNNEGGHYLFFDSDILYNNNATASNFAVFDVTEGSSDEAAIYFRDIYTEEVALSTLCNNAVNLYDSYLGQENPFVDIESDFHLLPNSNAIDGRQVTYSSLVGPEDIEGNSRIIGLAPDIGAYEFSHGDCPETIAYVNPIASGNNDGTSWEHAFTNLNAALSKVLHCEIEEIWVAEGTYFPSECYLFCNEPTDSTDFKFWIPHENISLFGGFPNTGNPTKEDRNWDNHPTILDGNIGNPNDNSDNSEKVVTGRQIKLDGFQVSGGSEYGIWSYDGRVRLTNCWIRNNQGGVYADDGTINLDDCRFSYNSGIIANAPGSYYDSESIRISRCIFEYNGGEYGGLHSNVVYANNSLFVGNTSEQKGGAINVGAYAGITSCTFVNNSSSDQGSAIYSGFNVGVWNSIFWGNYSAGTAKTIERENPSSFGIIENILTDHEDCESMGTNLNCGTGNIFNAVNPFISIQNDSFQLHDDSQALNNGNNNAGNSGTTSLKTLDLNQLPRIQDSIVDIGAYEMNNCSFYFFHQSDIDNFSTNYPGLDTIACDVFIRSSNEDPITNLNGLSQLITIGGFLWIEDNNSLTDVSGLENLSTIGGYFKVVGNGSIENLDGLENLQSIGQFCDISYNSALSSIDGFENLSEIGGDISIRSNPELTSINGFANLVELGGTLEIFYNEELFSINGFGDLTSTQGYLAIHYNDNLNTISGFTNLSHIAGYFNIYQNPNLIGFIGFNNLSVIEDYCQIERNDNLISLNGLQNLTTIGTYLRIQYNNSLASLSGLNNLNSDGMTGLTLRYNAALSICNVPFVCNYLFLEGPSAIYDNASGCNSDWEIIENCEEIGKIYHPLFYDINENGALDNGEPFLSNASVFIEPEEYISYGNSVNGGVKYLLEGDYTISYNESVNPLWELTTGPASYEVTINAQNSLDTVYFGLIPTSNITDVESMYSNGLPRCNEFVTFDVMAINNGTTTIDGTLWFTVDEDILNVNFIDTPDSIITPNMYGWHFTDLFPEGIVKKQISIQLPGPPDFPVGDFLDFETSINYADVNTSEGFVEYRNKIEVQCSFDPNDKLVSPTFPENYALLSEDLVYTIRFQNTGNAEAYDVVITDELDESFDLSTFKFISSSHESVLSTFLEERTITFEFKDIFLPDSTTNFDESQGYVIYSIRANESLEDFTSVNNTAEIFFDYNPAVVTNTTENIMLETFDADQDGFELWIDCDDNNPLVNAGATEIPYNGLDDDCNALTLDDDLDQDGFANAEDCDDNNYLINPDAIEIPYNGINDDCDELTLDDDLDQDGFLFADDCDDENSEINIDAEEIPNNGIDEDCDGEDTIVEVQELHASKPKIYPNPTSGRLQIIFSKVTEGSFQILDSKGKLVHQQALGQENSIDLGGQVSDVYILLLKTKEGVWVERIVKN